ncbi:MAG TPA: hypothetical protein VH684_30100 [Xanthobacteraceae bacterium]|jgi:hypothetical protein
MRGPTSPPGAPKRPRLEPLPGFDWSRVTWGAADAPEGAHCSYLDCLAPIGEDDVPLMLWDSEGRGARFCETCMRKWWGFSG